MSSLLTKEEIERLPKWLRPKRAELDHRPAHVSVPEWDRVQKEDAALRAHMSPAGALGLPELLDARRLEHGIPDEAFGLACAFGYVLVWQISQAEGETYGDTSIIMTDRTKEREKQEAPRGIVVSAGLAALDGLRSNGIDLGHTVLFSRNIPYRARIAIIGAHSYHLIVLQSGDIFASEDLARQQILGKSEVAISTDADTQFDYHYHADADGKLWKPHNVKRKV
jgi:hypothetical protein